MEREELIYKLGRIEDAINTKGHPMQDYSTMKMALIDLVDVVRKMLVNKEDKDAPL
ncbi:MAG: hypothetical protein V2A66_02435 [Pseudomonadota bacterium]